MAHCNDSPHSRYSTVTALGSSSSENRSCAHSVLYTTTTMTPFTFKARKDLSYYPTSPFTIKHNREKLMIPRKQSARAQRGMIEPPRGESHYLFTPYLTAPLTLPLHTQYQPPLHHSYYKTQQKPTGTEDSQPTANTLTQQTVYTSTKMSSRDSRTARYHTGRLNEP